MRVHPSQPNAPGHQVHHASREAHNAVSHPRLHPHPQDGRQAHHAGAEAAQEEAQEGGRGSLPEGGRDQTGWEDYTRLEVTTILSLFLSATRLFHNFIL